MAVLPLFHGFYICFRIASARLNYLWFYFSPCDDKYDLPGVLQVGRSSGDFPGQISMITVAGRILAEIQILQKLIWPEWELQPDSKAAMSQGLCCRSRLRLIRGLLAGGAGRTGGG